MNATTEHLWKEFAEKLGQFIRARVADPATAEDIRQDVFVKLQQQSGQLPNVTKLESWLYRIARNAIIDHYRTRKPTEEVPETLPAEVEATDGEIEALKASFRRMIFTLPEPYREAVVLTELEGLSQQELADRLGLSLSGAKSRVQRGRAQLKQRLEECCTFEFDRRGQVIDCHPRPQGGCRECEAPVVMRASRSAAPLSSSSA